MMVLAANTVAANIMTINKAIARVLKKPLVSLVLYTELKESIMETTP